MRKLIIAGNWKLNKTEKEAVELATALRNSLVDVEDIDIVICPVVTALGVVKDVLIDSNIALGAQNLYWEDSGAYTGEVSAPLLKSIGVEYVIIGHSERRQYFGETDTMVNKKIRAALKHGLTPIVCIGENLQQREKGKTFRVVQAQCEGSLAGFTKEEIEKMVMAYEPIWAIGTGKTATSEQAQEVQKFIRELLTKMSDETVSSTVRIQYGGSVKPDNIAELMAQPDIDGALVGGASLQADSFTQIVKHSCGVVKS